MHKIERVTGTAIPLLLDDIDTDRIIPARFLRCVTFDGLGEHSFEDDRKQDPHHPFDDPRFKGAKILVAGRNFGCGSSREHAPQALQRWGIAAIVGESFGEIFFGNCTALGLPCVRASHADLKQLGEAIQANPKLTLTVDLVKQTVQYGNATGDVSVPCTMAEGPRTALVTGEFDFLAQLLSGEPQIRAKAAALPYMTNFA
jgi:3-isopropylmalate/(R)-2-methylmalate dehydratase small subunit